MSVHTVNKIVLSYRAAKVDARTAIGAHAAEMETTPFRQISNPNRKPFSSPCWTPAGPKANRDSGYLQCCDVSWEKKQSSPATVLHHAYKYSVSTLKKLHSPYGKLSTRKIQER